jgi:hypothetical protein
MGIDLLHEYIGRILYVLGDWSRCRSQMLRGQTSRVSSASRFPSTPRWLSPTSPSLRLPTSHTGSTRCRNDKYATRATPVAAPFLPESSFWMDVASSWTARSSSFPALGGRSGCCNPQWDPSPRPICRPDRLQPGSSSLLGMRFGCPSKLLGGAGM